MFKLEIDQDACTGCGNCVIVCPVNSMEYAEVCGGKGSPKKDNMGVALGAVSVYTDFCTGCGSCMKTCAYDAIKVIPLEQKEEAFKIQKVEDVLYGLKRDVYNLIKSNGPMSVTEISEALGVSPKEASRAVYTLKNEGKLWENEKVNGRYTYFTEPLKKIEKETKEEFVTPPAPEIANKLREELNELIGSFNKVKIRFLIETEKLDRAREELVRREKKRA